MFPRFIALFCVFILIMSVGTESTGHVINKRLAVATTFAVGCSAFSGIRHCSDVVDDCPPDVCDFVEAACRFNKRTLPLDEVCKPEVKAAIEKFIRDVIFSSVNTKEDYVKNAIEKLGTQTSNALEDFVNSVKDVAEVTKKQATSFWNGLVNAVNNAVRDVVKDGKDAFDTVENVFAGKKTEEIGKKLDRKSEESAEGVV